MSLIKLVGLVTQSGADTQTAASIATGLSLLGSGFFGIKILGVDFDWVDCAAVAAADSRLDAIISTVETPALNFTTDDNVLLKGSWVVQNTGGVAVAIPVDPIKSVMPFPGYESMTVQDDLWLIAASSNTAQANDLRATIYCETVKLTETEWYRLRLAGV